MPIIARAFNFGGRRFAAAAALLPPLLLALSYFSAPTAWAAQTTLVPASAVWKFLDDGSDQGAAWRSVSFDDSAWPSGPAPLGYGNGNEATVVGYGPDPQKKHITTYFRRSFIVADPSVFNSLVLKLVRDDGAVVYLNGVEVWRSNMGGGGVGYKTLAAATVDSADETTVHQAAIESSLLVGGTNVLSAEVHQASASSSDLSFDLELIGVQGAAVTRGPYLQSGTPNAVTVRWRTDALTNSRVRYGTGPGDLTLFADDATLTTEHEVRLTGLAPETKYYYSVGTTSAALAGGDGEHFFVTGPAAGTPRPTRVWVLGDSGTADANARAVRDAYYNFAGGGHTNLLLLLGDNAYNSGTDGEYQAALFDMYPSMLRKTVVWPTLGNHDTAGSKAPAPSLPYFAMFTLPKSGEAGGLASGTEHYYSFDYGNIHFICLDSMASDRSPSGPMMTWLRSDLASTAQQWIIAFWHHPPYSKGSHNSDKELQLIEMRKNALPILEDGGVDLVLTGHSHSYERSFLLDGHYGLSSTLTGSMKRDAGDGRPDGGGAYFKVSPGPAPHEGAVYAVAGSSGKLEAGPLNHPAMFISLSRLGSLVLDLNGNKLDAKFIDSAGTVADNFTIVKGTSNAPPTIAITSPAGGVSYLAPANVTVEAAASDPDGTISRVDFYAGATWIGADTTSPYSVTWNYAGEGSYNLIAKATDNVGGKSASPPVGISISLNPPQSPWASSDVGAVGVSGLASYSSGAYMVKGSGADVGGTADAFHYLHQPLSGDGKIVARVVSVENTNTAAKAGLMIRESLAANSPHTFLNLTPGGALSLLRRATTGGTTAKTSAGTAPFPLWLMLLRNGSTFTAYSSSDQVNWKQAASATLDMPGAVHVGLAVTSRSNSRINKSIFEDVSVTPGTPNRPPQISLTAPVAGTTFGNGSNIVVSASATDADGKTTISKVEFYAGPTLIGADATSPYSVTWAGVPSGDYTLTAKVTDNAGASTSSPAANITVNPSGVYTLNPTGDAYVQDGDYAATNFGKSTKLQIRASTTSGENFDSYLKFDLQGVSGITNAKLRIYGSLSGAGSVAASLFAVPDSAWVETGTGGITWLNKPPAAEALGALTVVSATYAWYEMDVTQYIQSEKSAGRNVISLALRGGAASSRYIRFSARQAAAGKPELLLTTN